MKATRRDSAQRHAEHKTSINQVIKIVHRRCLCWNDLSLSVIVYNLFNSKFTENASKSKKAKDNAKTEQSGAQNIPFERYWQNQRLNGWLWIERQESEIQRWSCSRARWTWELGNRQSGYVEYRESESLELTQTRKFWTEIRNRSSAKACKSEIGNRCLAKA